MNYSKKIRGSRLLSLALSATAFFLLPACQSGQSAPTVPQTQPVTQPVAAPAAEPTVSWEPVEVTVDPGELIGTIPLETEPTQPAGGEALPEVQVIRAQDISQDSIEAIMARHPGDAAVTGSLPLIHLTSAAELKAFLSEAGSDVLKEAAAGYDDGFFQENDLLIVPCVTNTGSASHTVSLQVEDDVLIAQITVTTPEIVTMDMANWFLVIPTPKADTAGRICAAQLAGGGSVVLPPDHRVTR